MIKINVPLSEEEIGRLARNETDPERKNELLNHLSGQMATIVTVNNLNISNGEIARAGCTVVKMKAGAVIGEESKVFSLTPEEIEEVFRMVTTFASLNFDFQEGTDTTKNKKKTK